MSTDETRVAVLAAFEEMSVAWARMDAARFAACYTDDATVIGPGIRLAGKPDIEASMTAAFSGPLKGSLRPHTPKSVRFPLADTAVVVTESSTVFPGRGDVQADRRHVVTWILVRHGDDWLVEANHMCEQ